MMKTAHVLGDLELRVAAGERLSRADVERVFQCPDLVSVGVVGERARLAVTGNRVTFGRVIHVDAAGAVDAHGDAGEVRLVGAPATVDDARTRVRAGAALAAGRLLTGFALADLAVLCGNDSGRLTELARILAGDGLTAVAEVELDRTTSDEALIAQVQAVVAGGLGAWRLTVAEAADRLQLIERACAVQAATGAVRAFAPLPRVDRADLPSTGYDDVKTVAAARLRCADIERIQVDWPLYGPKLAQVAITFGANDVDGVSAVEDNGLGSRRLPLEDIRRQIRAAGGEPVERDAGYRLRN